uniref:Helicase n=1 Tax=Megaviridae environmental sample TaxID=1737588 RepID=A0A5J6VKR6_9VIRU|nr:MAG: helicase [Megaviridae environmental sample]
MTNKNFDNLNINDDLLKGIYLYGFKEPSDIQRKGIESINTGKDCILQSQSGTGKTATYLLGILNSIVPNKNIQGIVILPTRELAKQVFEVSKNLTKYTKIIVCKCIGGEEFSNLRGELVIGTVGRINHMIKLRKINLKTIKKLIIDEADNFIVNEIVDKELLNILDRLNDEIQIILISATVSKYLFNLSNKYLFDPIKILVKKENVPVDLIKQFYIDVENESNKYDVLIDLYNGFDTNQAIIFCNTIRKVNHLHTQLSEQNFSITSIHGQMTQEERNTAVNDFRNSKTRILLTTDLLARGIDIPHVNLVINYDITSDKDTYIHRIGRCGRFGKKGLSITFVKTEEPADVKVFNRLINFYSLSIKELPDSIDNLLK